MALDAPVVAVRLRRMWLGMVVPSAEYAAGDIDGDLRIRRLGNQLVVAGPYDFGDGDPFDGGLGDLIRGAAEEVTAGVVTGVAWRYANPITPLIRPRSTDLDILDPGDPDLADYPATLSALRAAIPAETPATARDAVGQLRLVAVSRHRLWFAARSRPVGEAIGSTPGARAALITAIQRHQGHEWPLYRIVVDPTYRRKEDLL